MGQNSSKVEFLFFLLKLLQYTVRTKKGSQTAFVCEVEKFLDDQGTIKKVNHSIWYYSELSKVSYFKNQYILN